MLAIIRYTLLTALRDRVFIGVLVAVFVAAAISSFLGGTALVEQAQMTLVYTAGSARLTIIVGLVLFVCFHVRRSFDNREIEVILSRPISRPCFVVSYFSGFAVLTMLLTLPVILIIWAITQPNLTGLLYWAGSLVLEGMLITTFALVSALIMKSAVASVLACGGFYLLSRMMGFFTLMISQPVMESVVAENKALFPLVWLLKSIAVLLPRLDLYGKTAWLLYGVKETPHLWLLQSLIYIPLLLGMAIWDFRRKQF